MKLTPEEIRRINEFVDAVASSARQVARAADSALEFGGLGAKANLDEARQVYDAARTELSAYLEGL